MTYRVINSKTNEDITDYYDWVISPNGELNYLDYSDLIGYPDAKAVFTVYKEDIP
jgi:hypothetical protein